MSGSDERGLTTEVVTTESETLKGATAEEMDVSETKHETNDPVKTGKVYRASLPLTKE